MKVLHIHVKKKYWNLVKQGVKEEEYRLIKPYWTTRLVGKVYTLIYYYCGYTKKKRVFRYDGYKIKTILHLEFGDKPIKVYAISLRKGIGVTP